MRSKVIGRKRTKTISHLGIAGSAAIHGFILWLLLRSPLSPNLVDPTGSLMEVTLEPVSTPLTVRPSIVAPSPETKEIPETLRLSESTSKVEKETVRRGDQSSSTSPSPLQKVIPSVKKSMRQIFREKTNIDKEEVTHTSITKRKEDEASTQEPEVPSKITYRSRGSLSLKLDATTVKEKFGKAIQTPTSESALHSSAYRAFSRPPGSGARFQGPLGTPDYLPNLPDGDLTLLNAKANKYAVFVRRVALQVFGEMQRSGWQRLSMKDLQLLTSSTMVEAVLSLEGKLLSVSIREVSGNPRYDESLKQAVKTAARDPHPPASAVAEDGNIHLIFSSRTWVEAGVNGRTQAPMERRWLLLATGLL
jgi:TonB family protein